jgi:alkylation response protein AidB-like acyl-CoA dehydrogenase
MRRVLDMTTEHISTRKQFGQPIAKFQAARHRAAEMLMQVETTRWAAYHALWRFDLDSSTDEIWLTKHWAVRAAARVYEISHLLHGGVGVSMEHPLHLYTQGIAAFAVRGGTMDELVTRTLASIAQTRPAGVQS